ncbi:MAG: hypothetical protein R3B84_16355 [Zavarzinella sp.]
MPKADPEGVTVGTGAPPKAGTGENPLPSPKPVEPVKPAEPTPPGGSNSLPGTTRIQTGKWGKGSYESAEASLKDHFLRHGDEVGASDIQQYLRKAEGFAQNLKGATKSCVDGATPGVTRYKKNGKYIDIDAEGNIISFSKQ